MVIMLTVQSCAFRYDYQIRPSNYRFAQSEREKNKCQTLMDALRAKHSKPKLNLQSLKNCFGQQCSPFVAVALCPNCAQRKKKLVLTVSPVWMHCTRNQCR